MRRILFSLLVPFTIACGGSPTMGPPRSSGALPPVTMPPVLSNGPFQPMFPPVASVRDMVVGERVEGVFGDGRTIGPGEHQFFTTVPSAGVLEVTLEWDPQLMGTLLKLTLEDQVFRSEWPRWSPVVGRLQVEAHQRYRIVVGLQGADWLPEDPFVLTSRMEP